jgi:arylsulfatase A-like enzyme
MGGWGYTTAEGGQRVPCIARWPGRIKPGVVRDQLVTAMDLLPTFARLAGTSGPAGRVIDGKDVGPLLLGESDHSPHAAFYYYAADQLHAVRGGKWKLYLSVRRVDRGTGGPAGRPVDLQLYDVEADPGETKNVAGRVPLVVARLTALAEQAREDLGDLGRPGKNQRPHGVVENPTPRVMAGR